MEEEDGGCLPSCVEEGGSSEESACLFTFPWSYWSPSHLLHCLPRMRWHECCFMPMVLSLAQVAQDALSPCLLFLEQASHTQVKK